MAPMYEPAVWCAWRGDLESCDSRCALSELGKPFGLAGCWRFQNPRKGVLGVLMLMLLRAGDCEYIDDPFTIVRTLLRNALNRDGECVACEASRSWS